MSKLALGLSFISKCGEGGSGDGLAVALILLRRHHEVDAKFGEFISQY
jgi:NAD(P)H-hydrate repair Nnr-like enzyme with NAD(P)H-hydrate epimerase domain